MSIEALSWAFRQQVLQSSQKFVLVALADSAGRETGLAYPSVETICSITALNHKTVRQALVRLVESKIIVDTGKKYGPTQQVKVYRLPDDAIVKPTQKRVASKPEDTQKRVSSNAESQKPTITVSSSIDCAQNTVSEDSRKTPERLPKDSRGGSQSLSLNPLTEEKNKEHPPNGGSLHSDFISGWSEAFKEHWGDAYVFSGGKDGAAVKRLLAGGETPANLICLARRAWSECGEFNRGHAASIAGFASRLNQIRVELKGKAPAGPVRKDSFGRVLRPEEPSWLIDPSQR